MGDGGAAWDLATVTTVGQTVEERIGLAVDLVVAFGEQEPVGATGTELVDAERRLGISLPPAVARAYATVALTQALNGQDRFLHPTAIVVDDGLLVLRQEAQGCARWGVAIDDPAPDPMVVIDRQGERQVDAGPFSSFVVFCALSGAVLAAPYGANTALDDHPAPLEPLLRPMRIEPFQFWPDADLACRFHGGPDVLVADHADTWRWAGCLTAEARDHLVAAVPGDWTTS